MSRAVKKVAPIEPDPWMSVRAAAFALGIQPPTVMSHAMAGRLAYQTVAGRHFISRDSVEKLREQLQGSAA